MFGRDAQAQAAIGRRGLLVGTAGALAGVALAGPAGRPAASAAGLGRAEGRVLPPLIHVREPGAPAGRALPYTGAVEVAAWEAARNGAGHTINWRFTTADALIKLKHHHPYLTTDRPRSAFRRRLRDCDEPVSQCLPHPFQQTSLDCT